MDKLIKYPILNKLRPGHRCKYIGDSKLEIEDFGFIPGKEYYIIDRLPRIIVFSTNKYDFAIDFGLNDGGDNFMSKWEICDENRVSSLPDVDFENENFYLFYEMVRLNKEVK